MTQHPTPTEGSPQRIELPDNYYFERVVDAYPDEEPAEYEVYQLKHDGLDFKFSPVFTEEEASGVAAAMNAQPAGSAEVCELNYHKVDRQVLLAASEMSEADKQVQPEWLWWNHESQPHAVPTFGRWSKILGGVPYVRADLLVEVLQGALTQPAQGGEPVMYKRAIQLLQRFVISFEVEDLHVFRDEVAKFLDAERATPAGEPSGDALREALQMAHSTLSMARKRMESVSANATERDWKADQETFLPRIDATLTIVSDTLVASPGKG